MNYDKLFESLQKHVTVSEVAIRERAHLLWEKGNGVATAVEYWTQAEQQLRNEVAANIIKKAISPNIQEVSAALHIKTIDYVRETTLMATDMVKAAMQRDQFILPDGVRYHRRYQLPYGAADSYCDSLIVEEAPKIRTIKIDMGFHTGRINRVTQNDMDRLHYVPKHQYIRIALPYVVYRICFKASAATEFYYYFRNSPLKTFADTLFHSHLPNTDQTGKPCVPWASYLKQTAGLSIAEKIKEAINFFWATEFNYSLDETLPSDERVRSFERWEELTKENPLFVLDVKWLRSGQSLEGLIKSDDLSNVSASIQKVSSKYSYLANEILTLTIPQPKIAPSFDDPGF